MSKSHFKFALLLNDKVITESIFPKHFIPNINLQDVAKDYIKILKQTLSTPDKELKFVGANKNQNELVNYINAANFARIPDSENKTIRTNLGYKNDEGFYSNDDEKFKYGLYSISVDENNKATTDIIIERNFLIQNYNPKSRFSYNLMNSFKYIVTDIQERLKKSDFEILHKKHERHPFSSYIDVEQQ
jgi:hypothetical protein